MWRWLLTLPWNNQISWGDQTWVASGSWEYEYNKGPDVDVNITTETRKCFDTAACASGFACIGGECIQEDTLGNTDPNATNGGCGLGVNNPNNSIGGCSSGGDSARVQSCTTTTAGNCGKGLGSVSGGGGFCGGGNGNERPILGVGNGDFGGDKQCDRFCDGWKKSFGGSPGKGCASKTCDTCEDCSIFGECEPGTSDDCRCGGGCAGDIIRPCRSCSPSGQCLISSCGEGNGGGGKKKKPGCKSDLDCGMCDPCGPSGGCLSFTENNAGCGGCSSPKCGEQCCESGSSCTTFYYLGPYNTTWCKGSCSFSPTGRCCKCYSVGFDCSEGGWCPPRAEVQASNVVAFGSCGEIPYNSRRCGGFYHDGTVKKLCCNNAPQPAGPALGDPAEFLPPGPNNPPQYPETPDGPVDPIDL